MPVSLFLQALRSCTAILLISTCTTVAALPMTGALTLQGSAIYSQLQLDYYLAQLYGTNHAKSSSASSAQVMKITVLATEWSQRSFNQYWSQAISINNSRAAIKACSGDLSAFRKIVKGDLEYGDQLVISRHAGAATKITLNDIELLKTSDDRLFGLLLNSWTGARPPSSHFKSAIVGETPAANSPQKFKPNDAPSQARIAVIRGWKTAVATKQPELAVLSQESGSDQAAAEPDSQLHAVRDANLPLATLVSVPAPVPAPAALPASAPAPVPTYKPLATIEPPATPPVAPELVPLDASAATNEISLPTAPAAEPKFNATAVAVAAPAHAEAVVSQDKIIVAQDDTPTTVQPADEEDELERALFRIYRSNLLKLTYQNLIYPTGAINRSQQGKVVLQLTLSRQGKVKQIDFETQSKFSALNRAAAKAVSEAQPFPAAPRKLGGKQIVVTLPINFVLSE